MKTENFLFFFSEMGSRWKRGRMKSDCRLHFQGWRVWFSVVFTMSESGVDGTQNISIVDMTCHVVPMQTDSVCRHTHTHTFTKSSTWANSLSAWAYIKSLSFIVMAPFSTVFPLSSLLFCTQPTEQQLQPMHLCPCVVCMACLSVLSIHLCLACVAVH